MNERTRQYQKEWRLKNPEKVKKYSIRGRTNYKKWCEEHKEERKEKMKSYHHNYYLRKPFNILIIFAKNLF